MEPTGSTDQVQLRQLDEQQEEQRHGASPTAVGVSRAWTPVSAGCSCAGWGSCCVFEPPSPATNDVIQLAQCNAAAAAHGTSTDAMTAPGKIGFHYFEAQILPLRSTSSGTHHSLLIGFAPPGITNVRNGGVFFNTTTWEVMVDGQILPLSLIHI